MRFRFFSTVVGMFCASVSWADQTPVPVVPLPPEVLAAQKLTLAQALQLAAQQNPQLTAGTATVAGAKANFRGQSAPANPTLSYGGLNNTVGSFDFGNLSNYSVVLPVETNGALGWRTRQAKNQYLAAQSDLRTTQITVKQSVVNAYIDLQTLNLALENEKTAYANAQRLSDLTEKQFSLGAAPETNAIRARIALTQEESQLVKVANDVRLARATLNVQLGRSPDEPIDAAEPLEYKPVKLAPEDFARLTQTGQATRPELASAEYNRQALRAAVGLQRSQLYPNLFFGTDFQAVSDGHFLVGISLPLFDFGSIRGSVRKAQQDVKVQEAQNRLVLQQVQLDIQSAALNVLRAQRTVEAFQDGILPRSESLLKRIEQGYSLGASTILDLIDAQNTYRSTRNDYYNALSDHRKALAQLERALGKPL